jgi:hypothetical protein
MSEAPIKSSPAVSALFNDRADSERGSSSMDMSSSMDVKALLQIELYESFNRLTKVLAGMSTIVQDGR